MCNTSKYNHPAQLAVSGDVADYSITILHDDGYLELGKTGKRFHYS